MCSNKNKHFIFIFLAFAFFLLSLQAYAEGVKIIIVDPGYERSHSYSSYGRDFGPDYDQSHRLRNKYYFDNRYRSSYGNRYYGQSGYRNNSFRNSYRYNNRSYCPY